MNAARQRKSRSESRGTRACNKKRQLPIRRRGVACGVGGRRAIQTTTTGTDMRTRDLQQIPRLMALLILGAVTPSAMSAQTDLPVTFVFHVVTPVNRASLDTDLREFFEKNVRGVYSYSSAPIVSAYGENATAFSERARSKLRSVFADGSLGPGSQIELGAVCLYENRPDWERSVASKEMPSPGYASVESIAKVIALPGARTVNVLVLPLVARTYFWADKPIADPFLAETFDIDGQRILVASSHQFTQLPRTEVTRGAYIVHEFGHWLDLHHPFREDDKCPDSDYANAHRDEYGTFQRGARFGQKDQAWLFSPPTECGGPEPVRNYMSYTADDIRTEFTAQQWSKMRRVLSGKTKLVTQEELACKDNGKRVYVRSPVPNPPTDVTAN